MSYIVFGLALGTFVSGLIEKFHKKEPTNWINPVYLFLISALGFVIFVYLEWPQLREVFSNLFS